MSNLTWISDEDLFQHVESLIQTARKIHEDASIKFGKNVIDPFSAIFQIAGFQIDYATWRNSEMTRQSQKSLQNHIGSFHEKILGSVKGWNRLSSGIIDLTNSDRAIIAEIKNKHNTVKKTNLSDLYDSLADLTMKKNSQYKGYKAYYVTIIPEKPKRFEKYFSPSDSSTGTRKPEVENILEIDGASFYDLVTNDENSLENLYRVLPEVISDILGNEKVKSDLALINDFFEAAYG